ncbi:sensor histidine kinase [Nocardioides sp. MAHUQ-72]|uniref:sensor histidine kinase n=1 Tax=unclassified Nocardioides TaxID=2615069 RepID=UPI003614DC62
MTTRELLSLPVLQGLTDDQVERLAAAGDEVSFVPGEVLFRSGQPADSWWLLLDGRVDLVRHVGHEDTHVGTMDTPGQWAGGFRAWDPNGVYMATGQASAPGRMLRVPADRLGELARAWFPFGTHLIRGLMQTVRSIESTARQREALVALGTLAAGLAHEINNPASAATRAVDALQDTCDTLMTTLRQLAESGLTAAQFVELDALRRGLRPPGPEAGTAGGVLALSDREEELSDWLTDHGVGEDWLVAPVLATAGADVAWCEQVSAAVGEDSLEPAVHWVASSLSTTTLLAEVKESTQRVSSLVAAVRSYSQLDRASVQRTDVAEGLESTLMVLAHKLDGVSVTRSYGDGVPQIEAIAGELNQVWTNLVDNAIDAMGGAGTLRVSTAADGDGVVVEIADTGPGIPADVLPHVFEPFFTTKDVGSGTGLGLDISRRIVVDRHGGDISVDRSGEETVFRVRLPAGR